MKHKLSKEEVEQLDEEQLKAYINVVRSRERDEAKLLESASGYRGRWSAGPIFILLFVVLSFSKVSSPLVNAILCFGVFAVVSVHSMGINRRIDSVLRLMNREEEDIEH